MLTFFDHALLWGSFFALGLILGFFMGYSLVVAGRGRRL